MTSLALLSSVRSGVAAIRRPVGRILRRAATVLPQGLYARALLIVVVPMVLLQSIMTFVFMERHWQTVTYRLSAAVTRDIAAIITLMEQTDPALPFELVSQVAADQLDLTVSLLPNEPFPESADRPFFSLLDSALSDQISAQIDRPFWIDTVGNSNLVEIRINVADRVLQVLAKRSSAYASNSGIFLVWMAGTALILIGFAVYFLRAQIRPIQRLAIAAEAFGRGWDVPDFRPEGSREVRLASTAFQDMRDRLIRQIEQRTLMLAGVSHDLRTILTRFKLELALMRDEHQSEELQRDVDAMQAIVEEYLDFAKGDSGEAGDTVNLAQLTAHLVQELRRQYMSKWPEGAIVGPETANSPTVKGRKNGIRRMIGNLLTNAMRYGRTAIEIRFRQTKRFVFLTIEDDGPGIPEEHREDVFKPFYRLDAARNIELGGTGLGLAIARDIARGHGGEIKLASSSLGGLRVTVRLPL